MHEPGRVHNSGRSSEKEETLSLIAEVDLTTEDQFENELEWVVNGRVEVSYEFRWIPLGQLFVDYHESVLNGDQPQNSITQHYQRRQERIARRIVEKEGFKPDLFGPLIVNQRRDGTYAVVDGGTRRQALLWLHVPADVKIPCLVFQWDNNQEIRNYVALNRERTGLSQVDFFIGKVKYGDEVSGAIERTLKEETGHGVHARKGGWQCVNALEAAHRRGNLRPTAILIRQLGWLELPRARTQGIVTSVSRLLFMGADEEWALKRWANTTPAILYREAKMHGDIATSQSRGVYRLVALQLVKLYNTNLRSRPRLDDTAFFPQADKDEDDLEG